MFFLGGHFCCRFHLIFARCLRELHCIKLQLADLEKRSTDLLFDFIGHFQKRFAAFLHELNTIDSYVSTPCETRAEFPPLDVDLAKEPLIMYNLPLTPYAVVSIVLVFASAQK